VGTYLVGTTILELRRTTGFTAALPCASFAVIVNVGTFVGHATVRDRRCHIARVDRAEWGNE